MKGECTMDMCKDCIHGNGEFGCELGPNQYPSCRRAEAEYYEDECAALEEETNDQEAE